jgi:hypothetical protein
MTTTWGLEDMGMVSDTNASPAAQHVTCAPSTLSVRTLHVSTLHLST